MYELGDCVLLSARGCELVEVQGCELVDGKDCEQVIEPQTLPPAQNKCSTMVDDDEVRLQSSDLWKHRGLPADMIFVKSFTQARFQPI